MKRLEIENEEFTKDELLDLFHKEKNPTVKERILAIVLMMEYKNCSRVAEFIGRSRNTVQNWVNDYNAKGLEGLGPAPRPGRPALLTNRQLEMLKKDLLRNPRELGYDFSNWDGKSVMYHIQQKFGVKFSVRRVQLLLHQLGFSLQRPRHKYIKADKEKQEQFNQELKKKSKIWVLMT